MRRISSLVLLIALGALALPAAAGAAPARSDSGDSVVVISGDVDVPRGETVDGVFVVSGDVRIAGHSTGDVAVLAGDAVISGRIDGDLFMASGRARLLPRAYVGGDVGYGDERPVVAGRAIVRGDVSKEDWNDWSSFLPFLGILFWLAVGVSAAILGALMLLIAPRAADAVSERSRERLGPVIAIGIAIAICLPVAAVIAAITVVGLPLAFGILLALLPLAAVAYVCSAWALGRRLVKPPRGRIVAFLAGLAILRLLALVPIFGGLVGLAAVVFGFGLIGAAIGAAREPRQTPPAPAQSPGS
ncbi:MAG TPA: polymer-forming cytoskeletal protein [Solirubrobacterales bacterium]|nr:polymer-forming cytoskeletal protein [Solirubrobacterales bacterium]